MRGKEYHQEQITGEPLIGREEYGIRNDVSVGIRLQARHRALGLYRTEHTKALSFRLHHNSQFASPHLFGDQRPASAYFTILDDTMIIEWGEIDTNGSAKLHDYLNRAVDYKQRVAKGGTVRSGHIAQITSPTTGEKIRVALIDSLRETVITPDQPEYQMVTTMMHTGIVPLTADGRPVFAETTLTHQEQRTKFPVSGDVFIHINKAA